MTHAFELRPGTDNMCLRCDEHLSKHPDKHDYIAKKQMDDIIAKGHQVMCIFPTEESIAEGGASHYFFYTVGRTVKERPELLLTGPLDNRVAGWVLNEAARMDDTEPFTPGMEIPANVLLNQYPVRIVEANPEAAEMNQALDLFGDDVTALQIIWPDMEGRFPGEPDFAFEDDEPVFGVAP